MALQEHRLDTVGVDDYIIAAVPATLIDVIWDKIVPLIMKPIKLSHGEASLDSIHKKLKTGDNLLLTISRGTDIVGIITLDIRVFESGLRTLYLPLIGGTEMFNWMDRALSICEAIAKDFDCTELRGIAVRKGWMRLLEKRGWEEVSTTIRCPIGGNT